MGSPYLTRLFEGREVPALVECLRSADHAKVRQLIAVVIRDLARTSLESTILSPGLALFLVVVIAQHCSTCSSDLPQFVLGGAD